MDVALPANLLRVAKAIRDRFHRVHEIALRHPSRMILANCRQARRREDGSGPGSKVFRGEILPRDLTDVLVDVSRPDAPPLTLRVDVLKQFLPRKIAAVFDNLREPAIVQRDLVLFPALAAKHE